MSDWKSRVVEEKEALDTKVKALSEFIGLSPAFLELPPTDQELMKEQNDVMWLYSEILGKRLERF